VNKEKDLYKDLIFVIRQLADSGSLW